MAFIQEVREWFDGPILLSGAIATGDGILAAQAMGADLAYIGSAFIATKEANADPAYKQALVENARRYGLRGGGSGRAGLLTVEPIQMSASARGFFCPW